MVYYLTRLASWLAGRVPRPVRLALAGPLTVLVYYGWVAKRRVTIANMAQILGTTPDDPAAMRLARDSWRNYGRYVSDFFYLPNSTPQDVLARTQDMTPAPGAFALIDEALAPGRGLIVVSAHFGAWDVAGVVVASHTPIYLIVETFEDPRMDRLVQEQRKGLGMDVLRIEKTPRQIMRVLQENGTVAVAVDRPVSEKEGVPVTFFGRTCYVPGGIAQIALKTGAAILPGACWYDAEYSSTYYVGAGPVIFPESTGDRKADTIRLMQRMFDALEAFIRERPEQWAMFRAFWPAAAAATAEQPSIETAGARRFTGRAEGAANG
jgi:KDO2-lipid IV(A) lauroyltransferase